MKIKTKLTLGVGLLFTLILILGMVGMVYINALKADTENILVANYNSIVYAKNILSLIEYPTDSNIQLIENNIRLQEQNISELGELEITQNIRKNFIAYTSDPSKKEIKSTLSKNCLSIMEMNLQATQRKSELAKQTANTAVFWIAITGTLCFLIAFTLLVNLPSNIANPIKELSQSIQQIANNNYSERVHFETHNEFGQLAKSFNTMAVKLEEYNNSNLAQLMMEKKRIETLINNMQDPVIGLDENLNIIFANNQAIQIIGLTQKEVVGQNAQTLSAKNDLIKMLTQDLTTMSLTLENNPNPIKIYSNSKESYFKKETLHITITPTGEENLQLIGHVILLRNITEYKELDFAKTNFIATVSHEFKTPIASIKMSLQLLENEKIGLLNDEQINLVNSIKDDTARLLKITGELLNLTQIESGNIQLAILPSSPTDILRYAIDATQTQANQKDIKLECSIPDKLPNILADTEKTAWVLTNLISNAIRYSYDHSAVQINISEKPDKVVFEVKDTGQGIAPQYKNKIFDRYFRVPGTEKEGTGLGLAISKEFIEAQGGSINVYSDFGVGSTFSIALNIE